MKNSKSPILIVGLPRSGTTWVGNIVSAAKDTTYFFEPDNEKISPLAWLCKKDVHRFPYLTREDDAGLYAQLWSVIFNGSIYVQSLNRVLRIFFRKKVFSLEADVGQRTGFQYYDEQFRTVHANSVPYQVNSHPFVAALAHLLLVGGRITGQQKRRIVKSVHTPLCLEWLTAHFPVRVGLVLRNPYSLYASYKRLKMPDGYRNPLFQFALQRDAHLYIPKDKLLSMGYEDHIAFQIILFYKVMQTQMPHHPEWVIISHDRLCFNPYERFKEIFDQFNLAWTDDIALKIEAHNKQGAGFDPTRITKLQPFKWQDELSQDETRMIEHWIRQFELDGFLSEYVYSQ